MLKFFRKLQQLIDASMSWRNGLSNLGNVTSDIRDGITNALSERRSRTATARTMSDPRTGTSSHASSSARGSGLLQRPTNRFIATSSSSDHSDTLRVVCIKAK